MSWSDKNIIFLISLPRSGSTLLQRILTAHPYIHSTSESWLLLPQFYSLRHGEVFSEYGHTCAAIAIEDFCNLLPEKKKTYYHELHQFTVHLFEAVTPPEKKYYLEKTPRNNMILDELLDTFPNSKFIFLWRNPLACAASIIETFGNGRWNLYKYTIDLYDGLANMVDAFHAHKDRIITINYEELLVQPDKCIEHLQRMLDLDVTYSLHDRFKDISFEGRMGDPTGIKHYTNLSTEPLEKWKYTLATPIRRQWAQHYLKWLGRERLAAMKYNYTEIDNDLRSINVRFNGSGTDIIYLLYGTLERNLQAKMYRHLIRTRHQRLKNHRYF